MTFVFDNIGLEKILALGQYRAKQILSLIGYESDMWKPQCSSSIVLIPSFPQIRRDRHVLLQS